MCRSSGASARADPARLGSTGAGAPAAGSMPSSRRTSGRRWQESAGSWRDAGEEAGDRARRAARRRARPAPLDAGGGGQGDAGFGAVSSGVRLPGRAAAEQQTRGPADSAAGPGRLPPLVEEAPQPRGECRVIDRAEVEKLRDSLKSESERLIEKMNQLDEQCDELRREIDRTEAVIAALERYKAA